MNRMDDSLQDVYSLWDRGRTAEPFPGSSWLSLASRLGEQENLSSGSSATECLTATHPVFLDLPNYASDMTLAALGIQEAPFPLYKDEVRNKNPKLLLSSLSWD